MIGNADQEWPIVRGELLPSGQLAAGFSKHKS
jgi:hypothetical protein